MALKENIFRILLYPNELLPRYKALVSKLKAQDIQSRDKEYKAL
jgi:hypothetical protein